MKELIGVLMVRRVRLAACQPVLGPVGDIAPRGHFWLSQNPEAKPWPLDMDFIVQWPASSQGQPAVR